MTVTAGDLGIMMPTGRVLADDGVLYESVQAAENAASSFIWIGPGTFSEAVTIDTAGLMVLGSGRGTLIDGGTDGPAITISAANVLITNLSVQSGTGTAHRSLETGAGGDSGIITNVWSRNSGDDGPTLLNGSDWIISNCIIENAGDDAFNSANLSRIIFMNNIIQQCSGKGFPGTDDSITATNIVNNTGLQGIQLGNGNMIAVENRVIGAGTDGIAISGTDAIVAKNRVSGSTNSDINDAGTNTVLSANRTGAAN